MAVSSFPVFRLKKGSEQRARAGHPWIYSNEIQGSPKGDGKVPLAAGEIIKLTDAGGKFIAWGYANPNSLIFFRTLSRLESFDPTHPQPFLRKMLAQSWGVRERLGLTEASFRWVFGEGDGLPGLVIDRYLGENGESVAVIQAHTAGMDRLLPAICEALVEIRGEGTAIVIRNDLSVRKLEGIAVEAPRVHANPRGLPLEKMAIRVRGVAGAVARFEVDLVGGQKTGFFLDQSENVNQVAQALVPAYFPAKKLRMLDLCAYVGQWSVKLALAYRARGFSVETVLVDASESALKFAKFNAERAGAQVEVLRADVLEGLGSLPSGSFDLVISDPPALIKGRKDLPQGMAAYLKLNTEAFRLVKTEGALIACSCSQLLEEGDFHRGLAKAAARNGKSVRVVARGTQALDHPLRLDFPEGKYLKMIVGLVSAVETPEKNDESR